MFCNSGRYYKLFIQILILLLIDVIAGSHLLATDQRNLLVPEPILSNTSFEYPVEEKAFNDLVSAVYSGDSLFLSGKLGNAESAYKKGFLLIDKFEAPWPKIILYNRIGYVNFWLCDIDETLDYYNRSILLIRNQKAIMDSLAFFEAYAFLKLISHTDKKYAFKPDIEKDIIKTITDKQIKNPVRKLKYHSLVAALVNMEGKFAELNEEIQRAEEELRNITSIHKFWPFLIRLYQGRYYMNLNDHNLAIRYFDELKQKVELEPELECFKYSVLFELIEANYQLHRYRAAEKYIKELKPFLESHHHPYFYFLFVRIGTVHKELGDFDEAFRNFKTAEKIMKDTGIEDEKLVYIYYYIAMYYKEVEWDQDMMLKYLHMAENILNRQSNTYMEMYIVLELCKYYYSKGEYDLAVIICNLVLDDVEKLVTDDDFFKSKYIDLVRMPYLLILDYQGAAFYYLSEQKNFEMVALKHSYENYKNLVILYEKIFRECGFEDSKIASLKKLRKAFENLFEVEYTVYEQTKDKKYIDELFSISEKSKAYMLKNYVSDELAKRLGEVPDDIIDETRIRRKEIDSMQYSFNQWYQNNYSSNDLLVNKMQQKQEEYDRFIHDLENRYPKYKQIKYQGYNLTIDRIREEIRPDQALLEYFFIFNSFYVFYVSADTTYIARQDIGRSFPQQLLNYRALFNKINFDEFTEDKIMNFVRESYSIYTLAIKPVEQFITNKSLIIVPDEELTLIPFETLIGVNPDSLYQTPFRDLPYLIMNNPISYLYSASQFFIKKRPRKMFDDYAGFAPDYSGSDGTGNSYNVFSLPGANEEIVSARKYFKGRIYTDGRVNKDIYFKECKRRRIIHLAMHAVVDSIEPMNSWFILKPQDKSSEAQLHAYEIYAQKNAASLVVLSACNTGMGRMSSGEGVFSIARAYLLAGVRNVIYTQWSVADRSSAELMDKFYNNLSQGLSTDVALQKAKIDFILKGDPVKAFPFYWSAHVLMGSPLEMVTRRKTYIGLVAILVLISIFILLWKFH